MHPSSIGPAADRQRHRQVLNELVELGADIARVMHAQITAPANDAPAGHPAPAAVAAFDRVVRCVRLTVMLVERLGAPSVPRVDGSERHIAARKRIIREVEDAIERRAEHDEANELLAEVHERLDAPDLCAEIDARPVDDIIADICRDLGIGGRPGPQIWKRRTPRDVEELCARAAQPYGEPSGWKRAPPLDHANYPERFAAIAAVPIAR